MTLYGLVISFEDTTCTVTITGGASPDLRSLIGKKVVWRNSEGQVTDVEDEFLVVKFKEGSKMPGQGGMVDIEE